MKLLEQVNYHLLIEPLRRVTINHLFARAVVEQKVAGKIFVDNVDHPKTYYIVHPYGMTLLLGYCHNTSFNHSFKQYALNKDQVRTSVEWMQTYPRDWDTVLTELFKDVLITSGENATHTTTGVIELNTRINFRFNKEKYYGHRRGNEDPDISISKATGGMFQEMTGSVVPSHFWNSVEDFLNRGLAFALLYKGELASMSFSSFRFDEQFELGIETKEKFRGRGFAELVCSAAIDYCIENNLEPVWACRLENIGSYNLAQKLGFEPTMQLPYYRLNL